MKQIDAITIVFQKLIPRVLRLDRARSSHLFKLIFLNQLFRHFELWFTVFWTNCQKLIIWRPGLVFSFTLWLRVWKFHFLRRDFLRRQFGIFSLGNLLFWKIYLSFRILRVWSRKLATLANTHCCIAIETEGFRFLLKFQADTFFTSIRACRTSVFFGLAFGILNALCR